MDVVLDLDLDFFVWPIIHWPPWGPTQRMPETSVERLASEMDVRRFVEDQCSMCRTKPILGRQVVKHDEAFFVWREWIAEGKLRIPFEVVHVDAHADLGLGDAGYIYLMTELLALPVEERRNPRRGPDAMGEGNYLAFALANQWISELLYVFPIEPADIAAQREAGMQDVGSE